MTAASLTSARQRCLESGMNDFLVKPVKLDTLRAMIERWAASCLYRPAPARSGVRPWRTSWTRRISASGM